MTRSEKFDVSNYVSIVEEEIAELSRKRNSERFTENLFEKMFDINALSLKASRDDVPKIHSKSGTWTPDGVVKVTGRKDREVFELKKPSVIISRNGNPDPTSQAYLQSVRYIAGSHSFQSDQEIKRVFCFNGIDLTTVEPASEERLKHFLTQPFWVELQKKPKEEIERKLRERSDLVQAYFPVRHLASLPQTPPETNDDKVKFRHHVRHFYENWLEEVAIDTETSRELVTKKNLKGVFGQFEDLLTTSPEEYFIRFAPLWTKTNIFHFKRNGFFYVFDKSGREITRIPKEVIKRRDLDSVEEFLKSYALESPEVFYDNFDTLLPKDRRKELGSYFTKKGLAFFAQYFITRNVDDTSSYHVVDPAAGSGTLLADFLARSVFGSDIVEFKHLLMDERKVRNLGEPIDFLKTTPAEYITKLNDIVGDVVENPLLVFSNPPYLGNAPRGELEKSLQSEIEIHKIKAHDLYVYFLIQMSRLFDAETNGLGKDLEGYICAFSPNTWTYEDRGEQQEFRDFILSRFDYEAGFLVDGGKFFDDMSQPVLFSILKRKKKVKLQSGLQVDQTKIYDFTKQANKIVQFTNLWQQIPPVGRFGFEDKEKLLPEHTLRTFTKSEKELFSVGTGGASSGLVSWAKNLPRFSKLMSAAHSHSGSNDLALSGCIIRKNSDVETAIKEFKSTLKLKESNEEIAQRLQLVFDDRPSIEAGYRFLYLDSERFPSQSVLDVDAPVINYFEEYKKSQRRPKFYNAAPITTDIAVAQLSASAITIDLDSKLDPKTKKPKTDIAFPGFKKIALNSDEYRYLKELQTVCEDLRAIPFLRAFINELAPFKELARNKAVNSALVWMPELRSDSKALLELISLSFAHTVACTSFDAFTVKFGKTIWTTKDYFSPDGWLKESGLLKTLHTALMPKVGSDVKRVCQAAVDARRKGQQVDLTEIIKLGNERYSIAGFLPSEAKKAAKVAS